MLKLKKNLSSPTLIVDLDGTLLLTDLIFERVLLILKNHFSKIFYIPFWLLGGKLNFKKKLAESIKLNYSNLPYRESLILYLKDEQKLGTKIILISGSLQADVTAVANHIGLFSEAYGSTKINLVGKNKLNFIITQLQISDFKYLGDSNQDLIIWKAAKEAGVVNPSANILNRLKKCKSEVHIIDQNSSTIKNLIIAMRPHQWIKNTLIFVPMIMAHQITYLDLILNSIIGFFSFSMFASTVYLINDILDVNSDRMHPSKKNRPFAKGEITPIQIILTTFILVFLGTSLSIFLPKNFLLAISIYLSLNLAYSLYIKKKVILDVIALSTMYSIRIFAGGFATVTIVSNWLLIFTQFTFFSLALLKRYIEVKKTNFNTLNSRDYGQIDLPILFNFGTASFMISIAIIMFYLNSPEISKLYTHSEYFWCIASILLYWHARIWILANRSEVDDDPVKFAITDKISWLSAALVVLIIYFSI